MTATASQERRLDRAVSWTGAGFTSATAALCLMFAVTFLGLGAVEGDPNEGVSAYVLGAVGGCAWLFLIVVGGISLEGGNNAGRRWLLLIPALISMLWCGLTALAHVAGLLSDVSQLAGAWPMSLGSLWGIVAVSIMTLGTIPAALIFLVLNVVLRLVRIRRLSPGLGARTHIESGDGERHPANAVNPR
jgi:hypothetical protein